MEFQGAAELVDKLEWVRTTMALIFNPALHLMEDTAVHFMGTSPGRES